MVEVGVRQQDGVERRRVERERDPVADRLVRAALEHAAVDEDRGLLGGEQELRAGDGRRATEEVDLHGAHGDRRRRALARIVGRVEHRGIADARSPASRPTGLALRRSVRGAGRRPSTAACRSTTHYPAPAASPSTRRSRGARDADGLIGEERAGARLHPVGARRASTSWSRSTGAAADGRPDRRSRRSSPRSGAATLEALRRGAPSSIRVGGETIDRLTAFTRLADRRRSGRAPGRVRGDGAALAGGRRRRRRDEPVPRSSSRRRAERWARRRLGHRGQRRRPRHRAGGARADAPRASSRPVARSSPAPPVSGPGDASNRGTTATSSARPSAGCWPRSRSSGSGRSTTRTSRSLGADPDELCDRLRHRAAPGPPAHPGRLHDGRPARSVGLRDLRARAASATWPSCSTRAGTRSTTRRSGPVRRSPSRPTDFAGVLRGHRRRRSAGTRTSPRSRRATWASRAEPREARCSTATAASCSTSAGRSSRSSSTGRPGRRPNDVWAEIVADGLGIEPHPEWSWWAVRGQLIERPGYLANYALSAITAAALRARIRELRGDWSTGDPGWYAFVSERLLRYGGERSPADAHRGPARRAADRGAAPRRPGPRGLIVGAR